MKNFRMEKALQIAKEVYQEKKTSVKTLVKPIKNLKIGKAASKDFITAEAWKVAEGKIIDQLLEVLRKLWVAISIPFEWTERILVRIHNSLEIVLICRVVSLTAVDTI